MRTPLKRPDGEPFFRFQSLLTHSHASPPPVAFGVHHFDDFGNMPQKRFWPEPPVSLDDPERLSTIPGSSLKLDFFLWEDPKKKWTP